MPLSLTCSCGSHLEIDDKFAGQVIRCPDCHKELTTTAAPAEPTKTSGYAIASLLFALVGALTVFGPLLAMACGLISLRHQARHPELVGGKNLARAGIVLGGLFLIVSLAAHVSPDVLGIDGIFRRIEWAGQLDYPEELRVRVLKDTEFALTRFDFSWGIVRHRGKNSAKTPDDLILVKPQDDAQVACMTEDAEIRADPEDYVISALERFRASELVHLLGGLTGATGKPPETVRDKKKVDSPKGSLIQEMYIDVKLGGYARTFLLRVSKFDGTPKITILAAGTRKHHFARLEPELRKIVESYRVEK